MQGDVLLVTGRVRDMGAIHNENFTHASVKATLNV